MQRDIRKQEPRTPETMNFNTKLFNGDRYCRVAAVNWRPCSAVRQIAGDAWLEEEASTLEALKFDKHLLSGNAFAGVGDLNCKSIDFPYGFAYLRIHFWS